MSATTTRHLIPALAPLYDKATPVFETLLRVVVGGFLVPHGAQKLFGAFGGYGLTGTAGFMESLGFAPGILFAALVGGVEFFGGILLAIGLLTRPAAVAATIVLAVAAISVHLSKGFFMQTGGIEFSALWTFAAAYFAFRGAGPYSVDAKIGREI